MKALEAILMALLAQLDDHQRHDVARRLSAACVGLVGTPDELMLLDVINGLAEPAATPPTVTCVSRPEEPTPKRSVHRMKLAHEGLFALLAELLARHPDRFEIGYALRAMPAEGDAALFISDVLGLSDAFAHHIAAERSEIQEFVQ